MTENEAIVYILDIARGEIGYHEKATGSNLDSKRDNSGGNNYTKYARDLDAIKDFYNGKKQGSAWCDVFYDWLHVKAWGPETAKKVIYQPNKSSGAGCLYSARYYMQAKRFYSSPKPGDQIFFLTGAIIGHTGIVESVTDTEVTTIEGNNGNCVARHVYKLKNGNIAGYGRPNYKMAAGLSDAENTIRQLKRGNTGEDVRALQEDLIFLGYDLPTYGADGSFGKETESAVKKLQEDNGLEVDGVVGDQTRNTIDRLKKGKTMAIKNDELALYEALIAKGFSHKATSVCLGHGTEESGNECNRIQGDFSADRSSSKKYTAKVDGGELTRDDFLYRGPNGGGYGWLQWTFYSRKAGLYDTAKRLGVSVGSVKAAVEWFWEEIHQAEYAAVLKALQSDMSIREISDVFMKKFERPADMSDSACARRASLCQQIYDKYLNYKAEPVSPVDEHAGDLYWPPRVLCKGMEGGDVSALQGLLIAHGYQVSDELGKFESSTEEAVRKYQEANGLEVDGIAGPITFAALTKF